MINHEVPRTYTTILFLLAFAAVLAGMVLRVRHLETKPFWWDEEMPVLVVQGKTITDLAMLLEGGPVSSAAVRDFFEHPSPASTYDIFKSPSIQPSPLYYVLLKFWHSRAGSSPARLRLLSAVFGCLTILAAGWAALEMSGRAHTTAVVMTLFALSPPFVEYSHEIHDYTLWMCLELLLIALLFRALRKGRASSWLAYAGLSFITAFTDLRHLVVLAAHGAFAVHETFRKGTVPLRRFFIICGSLTLAGLVYVRWALEIIQNPEIWAQSLAPIRHKLLLKDLWRELCNFAVNVFQDGAPIPGFATVMGVATLLVLCWCALGASSRAGRFISIFAGVYYGLFVARDLAVNNVASLVSRYQFPVLAAFLLAWGFFLATQLESPKVWRHACALVVLVCAVISGATSGFRYADAECWWTAHYSCNLRDEQQAVRTARNPLVIGVHYSELDVLSLASLAYADFESELLLLRPTDVLPRWENDRTVYVRDSHNKAEQLARQTHIFSPTDVRYLWRVSPKPAVFEQVSRQE